MYFSLFNLECYIKLDKHDSINFSYIPLSKYSSLVKNGNLHGWVGHCFEIDKVLLARREK